MGLVLQFPPFPSKVIVTCGVLDDASDESESIVSVPICSTTPLLDLMTLTTPPESIVNVAELPGVENESRTAHVPGPEQEVPPLETDPESFCSETKVVGSSLAWFRWLSRTKVSSTAPVRLAGVMDQVPLPPPLM